MSDIVMLSNTHRQSR